ncbi:MAG TPA: DUF523 domain-containing protein [Pseudomonas sp.]|nr:DUF523 domain-containing protein [Pseudomonas sp.]
MNSQNTSVRKPKIGISACLLGSEVRYNGGHKESRLCSRTLTEYFDFIGICPEVAIGLPVPRPPIQVVQVDDALRVKGVENPQQDVTEALEDVAAGMTEPLSGFVLKARSPSCGHLSTPVHNAGGQQIGMASGAFARKLHELFPRIPLANDSDLEKPAFLQSFLLQVYCYHQWHHSDHQGQWLNDMQAQSEQLDEPLHSGLRHYLDKLGQAMH